MSTARIIHSLYIFAAHLFWFFLSFLNIVLFYILSFYVRNKDFKFKCIILFKFSITRVYGEVVGVLKGKAFIIKVIWKQILWQTTLKFQQGNIWETGASADLGILVPSQYHYWAIYKLGVAATRSASRGVVKTRCLRKLSCA